MTFGKKIQALRLKRGFSQEQLASYLGVTAQEIDKWERDFYQPNPAMFPRIASVLGTTVDELVGNVSENVVIPAEDKQRISEDTLTKLITGAFLIGAGILLLITNVFEPWVPFSFWDFAWPLAIMYGGFCLIARRKYWFVLGGTGVVLLGVYTLLSNLEIIEFTISWSIIAAFALIYAGVSYFIKPFAKK